MTPLYAFEFFFSILKRFPCEQHLTLKSWDNDDEKKAFDIGQENNGVFVWFDKNTGELLGVEPYCM